MTGHTLRRWPRMSLRDYFAGQALAGILASLAGNVGAIPNLEKSVAQSAYDFADAMLRAENRGVTG